MNDDLKLHLGLVIYDLTSNKHDGINYRMNQSSFHSKKISMNKFKYCNPNTHSVTYPLLSWMCRDKNSTKQQQSEHI